MADPKAVVIRDVVAPEYIAEVKDVVRWRYYWRKIANWAEGLSYALIMISTVVSFIASAFDDKRFMISAGCCNAASLALRGFSAYASKESSERSLILNRLLAALNVAPMPDFAADLVAGAPEGPAPGGPVADR